SQRRAYRDASVRKNKSADRAFVLAAPLLKHGDSLAQLAGCFEVAKEENSIGKIADIDRRIHPGADQSVLRERKYRIQTLLVQVGQELMQLESQKTFPGHGIEKTIEAVDHDQGCVFLFDESPHVVNELAWRYLSGIELLQFDATAAHVLLHMNPQTGGPVKVRSQSLVECEYG